MSGKVRVAVAAGALDGTKIWGELIREIKSQRPLINAWVQAGRLLGIENDQLRVGFPTDQKMFVESLGKPNNRKLLEAILGKLAGRPLGLKLELLDADADEPAANGQHPPASRADVGTVDLPEEKGRNGAAVPTPAEDPAESFKNDPLIQKALKIFEGEIRSVNRPD